MFFHTASKNWSKGRTRFSFGFSRIYRWFSNNWSLNWVGSCNYRMGMLISNNDKPNIDILKKFDKMGYSNISDIWLVSEPDGLKVKVRLSGSDEYIAVINETKVFNADGSASLISHNVSSSGIEAKANNKSAV